MGYDFDTVVDRSDIGNMIEESKPRTLREAGLPSYWGAEFDFKTAPSVISAIKKAADRGLLGFTVAGPDYLGRVAWWYEEERRCPIRPEWVLPTHGTIFSLATSIRAFTKTGEGIVMLSPGYMRYRQAADRLGRKTSMSPLILHDGRYRIDFDDLESRMAKPRNKLFVLCNPNNPTGTIWDAAALARVAELAAQHGLVVFSDEIFAEVAFRGASVTPYHSAAGEGALGISCSSLGKCFGFTGVNHANVVIPNAALRDRFLAQRNADHFGSLDPILYAALMGAYTEEGAEWLGAMRDYVWGNYLLIDSFFREKMPGVSVFEPEGSYVLWIDFGGLDLGGAELKKFLVEEALLCLDAGESYGGPPEFMRMNISVPRGEIARSLDLLLKAARARGFAAPVAEEAEPREVGQ
ncbi:MAG: aminotransferase class I/II-fold pyridoxal phosphate-dependent enzyme [Spirochaetaceae bacterium]|nr:aminotransferase class I/II-fold pyridoxal phosphate-dependent enzyme [Spirochaetaceae bacterium]